MSSSSDTINENLKRRNHASSKSTDSSSEESSSKEDIQQQQQQQQFNGSYSTSQINSTMTSKEAYFELLRTWVNQANRAQTVMAYFPYYLMANYPQLFPQQQQEQQNIGRNRATTVGSPRNLNIFGQNVGGAGVNVLRERRFADYFDNELRLASEELINENGGYEFIIAPFWKRFVAEIIDSLILLLLKLVLTFTIVDLFDLNFGIFDLDNLKKSIEDDYAEFISFSSDLLLIEILTKILVCFYEAMWTSAGHNIYVGGATPGKILMGLRIIHAEAVLPLPQQNNGINNFNTQTNGQLRALLYPGTNPDFKRSLGRAIAKNILMALLFPMCFVMLFFRNNRTVYDVMTKTIVVEENAAPVYRRRRI